MAYYWIYVGLWTTDKITMKKFLSILVLVAACAPGAHADTIRLRSHVPDRYTVVPGDTLWTIAGHFLKDPWQWPEIWNHNAQIHNPHLIYPGDVIVLSYDPLGRPELAVLPSERLGPGSRRRTTQTSAEGNVVLPIVALRPAIGSEPYVEPVPTIKPEAIAPFLVRMGVVEPTAFKHAAYVLGGTDRREAIGTLDTFYGRRLGPHPAKAYIVERLGAPLKAYGTQKILGYQTVYIGRAHVIHAQSPRMLRVDDARRTVRAGDWLVPAPPSQAAPYYYPKPPKTQVQGHIVAALQSMTDLGPGTVVAVDLGRDQGMRAGDVLNILRRSTPLMDPNTHHLVVLPERRSGMLMVFRPFARVSYALVMSATRPIRIGDAAATP